MGNKSVAPAQTRTYYTYNPQTHSYSSTTANSTPAPEMNTTVTRTSVVETHSGGETRTTKVSTSSTHVNQTNADSFPPPSSSTTQFVSAIRPTPVYVPESTTSTMPVSHQTGQSSVVVVSSHVTHVRSHASSQPVTTTTSTANSTSHQTVQSSSSSSAAAAAVAALPPPKPVASEPAVSVANVANTQMQKSTRTPTPSIDQTLPKPAIVSSPFSPDSSVVSPSVEFPPSPSPMPTTTEPTPPAKPTNPSKMIQFPSPATSPLPNPVVPKRSKSKISVSTSTHTPEPNQRNKHEECTQTNIPTQNSATSPIVVSPSPNETPKEKSLTLNIAATPTFALRSTAVSNPSPQEPPPVEPPSTAHKDMSIFAYHLTQHDPELSIGNHAKATMFKMDTRRKQTPLPTPSLQFFSKNFNDGTYDPDDSSVTTATFSSLGLLNDVDIESGESSSREPHANNKPQETNGNRPSSKLKTLPKNPSPLPPILKKPGVQAMRVSISTQTGNDPLRSLQNGHHTSTPVTRAIESITRSQKLFSKRSIY